MDSIGHWAPVTCMPGEHLTIKTLAPPWQLSQSTNALVSRPIHSVPCAPSQSLTGTMYKHLNTYISIEIFFDVCIHNDITFYFVAYTSQLMRWKKIGSSWEMSLVFWVSGEHLTTRWLPQPPVSPVSQFDCLGLISFISLINLYSWQFIGWLWLIDWLGWEEVEPVV